MLGLTNLGVGARKAIESAVTSINNVIKAVENFSKIVNLKSIPAAAIVSCSFGVISIFSNKDSRDFVIKKAIWLLEKIRHIKL